MILKPLTRDVLAKFLPNEEAIRRFEELYKLAGGTTPANVAVLYELVQEVSVDVATAMSTAIQAVSALQDIAVALDTIASAPQTQEALPVDDAHPVSQLGTIASQNADAVGITGGVASLSTLTITTDEGLILDNQTDGAGASIGQLLNAPAATDPDFWRPEVVNGTTYLCPLWLKP